MTQQFKRPAPVQSLEEKTGDEDKRARTMPVASQSGPLFQLCVKSTDDVSWQEKREAQLQKALKHWLILIGSWRSEIEFVTCVGGCENTNAQLIMLGDVFRGKAPSTLTKRANSMKVLCSMLEQDGYSFHAVRTNFMGSFVNFVAKVLPHQEVKVSLKLSLLSGIQWASWSAMLCSKAGVVGVPPQAMNLYSAFKLVL